MIIEAEKSLHVMSSSWSPRKMEGIIQSESQDLRTRVADGVLGWPKENSFQVFRKILQKTPNELFGQPNKFQSDDCRKVKEQWKSWLKTQHSEN